MKKSEVKGARTQDLVLRFAMLMAVPTITKAEQKQVFWIIEELISRGIIEDDMEFVTRINGFIRWDVLPEKYMPLAEKWRV